MGQAHDEFQDCYAYPEGMNLQQIDAEILRALFGIDKLLAKKDEDLHALKQKRRATRLSIKTENLVFPPHTH